MAASVQGHIVEQRHELMVCLTGGIPIWRKAHFIKPSISSIDGPTIKLPSLSPMPIWPLEVVFSGWMDPIKKWKTWVDKLESKYHSFWKKVGIYEAIKASPCIIHDDSDLIFGLAERWCSETNTPFLPWGEATITLEDLLILGGFSVLGSPVPLESPELVDIENPFISFTTNNHCQWLTMFMDEGTESEHIAFLSLWLSRFVFPGNVLDHIGNHVFRIAIYLARGTRLALAPAVLASIYRDMGLLKASMADSTQIKDGSFLSFALWSPLCYIQVWAWERLPILRPKPNFMNETMDNWSIPKLYKEKEDWVVGYDLDSELESLARCLRPSKLVWIDCQEPNNAYRVAMQFGLDQDLPGWISWDNISRDIAWYNFTRPLSYDNWLYLPSRLSESDVTARYLEWWRKIVLCPVDDFKNVVKRQRSSRVPRYRPDKLMKLSFGKVAIWYQIPVR
ncbi:uncharacterized protein LOC111404661 [Olea europaea var. sylvestris]|uniref:uncharacterized protein LOC111404661 n=1 Tax=Olea europaea var. sylvestris TaxID=158386 RepID=UPI000C1D1A20|nr:uncharacterized protein LOC111404661 [Olea europaea var. sylvestris]